MRYLALNNKSSAPIVLDPSLQKANILRSEHLSDRFPHRVAISVFYRKRLFCIIHNRCSLFAPKSKDDGVRSAPHIANRMTEAYV